MATVDGEKELQEKLKKINKSATNDIEQALIDSALIVEQDAKLSVPVDTGRLRQGISHELKDSGTNAPYAEVGTNVTYAPYVEYGSSKMAARPFLFPAYNNNKQRILKELAKAFKKGCGL
jgi:HK97 gp10 family phage protein